MGKFFKKMTKETHKLFLLFFAWDGTALVRLLPNCEEAVAGGTNASSSSSLDAQQLPLSSSSKSSMFRGSSSDEIVMGATGIFTVLPPGNCNPTPDESSGVSCII